MLLQIGILVFGLGAGFLIYAITAESVDIITNDTMVEGKEFKHTSYGVTLSVVGALFIVMSALMDVSW